MRWIRKLTLVLRRILTVKVRWRWKNDFQFRKSFREFFKRKYTRIDCSGII